MKPTKHCLKKRKEGLETAQVIGCLPSKCEALSSNPRTEIKGGGEEREEWEYNGGGEVVQSTLYTCVELSQ
jgi:hypothetical protein